MKTISCPQGRRNQHFAAAQKSARKDVERAFGVLQARFATVRGAACLWDEETLASIIKACIIIHNMIIEDEGDTSDIDFDGSEANTLVLVLTDTRQDLEEFIRNHHQIRDRGTHSQL